MQYDRLRFEVILFIDVDQDALGIQSRRDDKTGLSEIFSRPLSDGNRAAILFNRDTKSQTIGADWTFWGLSKAEKLNVKNLWSQTGEGSFTGSHKATVPSQGAVILKVYPDELVRNLRGDQTFDFSHDFS